MGGDVSEAVVRFGNDCPDKFGIGICTVSVLGLGLGDFDKKRRLDRVIKHYWLLSIFAPMQIIHYLSRLGEVGLPAPVSELMERDFTKLIPAASLMLPSSELKLDPRNSCSKLTAWLERTEASISTDPL